MIAFGWIAVMICLGTVGFIVMVFDKKRAKVRGARRVPEKTLLSLAFWGGAWGVYLAMIGWRHKTKHWYFKVFVPLLMVLHLTLAAFLFVKFA